MLYRAEDKLQQALKQLQEANLLSPELKEVLEMMLGLVEQENRALRKYSKNYRRKHTSSRLPVFNKAYMEYVRLITDLERDKPLPVVYQNMDLVWEVYDEVMEAMEGSHD